MKKIATSVAISFSGAMLAACSGEGLPDGEEETFGETTLEASSGKLPIGVYLYSADATEGDIADDQFKRLGLFVVSEGVPIFTRVRWDQCASGCVKVKDGGMFDLTKNATTGRRYVRFYEDDGITFIDKYEYELKLTKTGKWTGKVLFTYPKSGDKFYMHRSE